MVAEMLTSSRKNDEFMANIKKPSIQTILIVDDEVMNRKLGEAILTADDNNIVTAENGAQALACVAKAPPDLVLLDMLMPGMSGLEVLKKLRDDAATAKIPVIMVTGMADHESVTRALDAGADACLCKPVDPDELILQVKNMLRLR